MTTFSRFDLIEHYTSPLFFSESLSIFSSPLKPFTDLDFTLDLLNPSLNDFDTVTDLIEIERSTPFGISSARKLVSRRRSTAAEFYLQSLSDRVSALELGFGLVKNEKVKEKSDRKYTWTAEISRPEKDGLDRKYKLTTEIKGGKKKEKSCRWKAEIKRKGDDSRKYTFTASASNAAGEDDSGSEKKEKEKNKKDKVKKKEKGPRIVEIQDVPENGAVVLRQAFTKRALERNKGKKKELSPQDAAIAIQMTFRAYLIRRSQALRALRELAVAKAKLKDLRSLFNNFSYRRRVAHEAEERQRFTEKIIVLLLTVDAIEGADIMVRAAKRSMVDELEAMLDAVDPHPAGSSRSLSRKRRTFDMPDGVIQKELAAGVVQVVRMLEQEQPNGE